MHRTTLAVLTLIGLIAVACGGGGGGASGSSGGAGGGAATNTWVGTLADSGGYIAIMKEGTAHLIYVTDGEKVATWFKGDASGAVVGYFTFYNDEGGSIINNPDGAGFGGTVTVAPGRHFKYTAAPARGEAGLYRAKETAGADTWQSGWIVLNDGAVKGARINQAGTVEPLTTRGGVKWTNPASEP